MSVQLIDNNYFLECPHCGVTIEVPKRQVNCKIFRCGVYKQRERDSTTDKNSTRSVGRPSAALPINPHASKEECERLVREGLIYGCGGAFRFDGKTVEKCDYI